MVIFGVQIKTGRILSPAAKQFLYFVGLFRSSLTSYWSNSGSLSCDPVCVSTSQRPAVFGQDLGVESCGTVLSPEVGGGQMETGRILSLAALQFLCPVEIKTFRS